MELQILYEDDQLMVCRKEAGIPTQTNKIGQMDMVSLIRNYRVNKKEEPYVGLVHRLDQPVEGIMVFAKNKQAAASLSRQVSERSLDKEYYAVVKGVPKDESGTLENYLLRDGRSNTSKVVSEQTKDGKLAVLDYRVLKTMEDCSLLKVKLHTGRHHQIRVQLSHVGYPIVGDRKYGPTLVEHGYLPLALCSCYLQFEHPHTRQTMEFEITPLGRAFSQFFMV